MKKLILLSVVFGCSSGPDALATRDAGVVDGGRSMTDSGPLADAGPVVPPIPSCAPASDVAASVSAPSLLVELSDRWHEGWLGSPGVADLDDDGEIEILLARDERLIAYHADGAMAWTTEVAGRIWASPVVGDLDRARAGLEVAFAARDSIYAVDANGVSLPGFPVAWRDELRSLAAGDIDSDGALELVAVTTDPLERSGQRDILIAVNMDGSIVNGFPPNTSGAAGCDDACYVTGGYDQNLALGDVNGDGRVDILATQDNAYGSLHEGSGRAFDAADIFRNRTKFHGVRFLHDYDEAQQGYAEDEASANQAHFTNSAPALADVDGDGVSELVMLGSVQNASQGDRLRGVGLWVVRNDGTRIEGWEEPFHAREYLGGLWDFGGVNLVGATNQVSVGDLFADSPGPEFVFAGFDGRIHCVDASRRERWAYTYTTSARVLTSGVAIADLSGDGAPELVFATYSPDDAASTLQILDTDGLMLHSVPLPGQGAMSVPTIADVDGDGHPEIVVALKGGDDGEPQALVYSVASARDNCLVWPTGRGNLRRTGSNEPLL